MTTLREHWDIALLVAGLLLTCSISYAYIDPGTASTMWAAGLAPFLGFLAYFGRRIARAFRGKRPTADDDESDADEEDDDIGSEA